LGKPKKNILVCPLNWGLGHASRDIPVIHLLIKMNFRVFIGGDGYVAELLKAEFPECTIVHLPSCPVKYTRKAPLYFKLLWQIPGFFFSIIKEHYQLKTIISKNYIDFVISDNRYGLWNKNVYSIFITHQLFIRFPGRIKFLEPLAHKFIRFFILKYNSCWTPDFEDIHANLSGSLSHHKGLLYPKIKYIGPLSRFEPITDKSLKSGKEILVILSGPEPQRTILESMLLKQLEQIPDSAVIIRGIPGPDPKISYKKNLILYDHVNTCMFNELLSSSGYIICRPGYSTIMDLFIAGKTAILIPTPGQTEQEYLAEYLSAKKLFVKAEQDKLNIKTVLQKLKRLNTSNLNYTGKVNLRSVIEEELVANGK
jgi:predicted glycosyltransferase